jgi:hypothetical protein
MQYYRRYSTMTLVTTMTLETVALGLGYILLVILGIFILTLSIVILIGLIRWALGRISGQTFPNLTLSLIHTRHGHLLQIANDGQVLSQKFIKKYKDTTITLDTVTWDMLDLPIQEDNNGREATTPTTEQRTELS